MGFFDKFGKSKGGAPKTAVKKEAKKDAAKEGATEVQAVEKKPVTRGPLAKDGSGNAHKVLLRPIFTEKSARLESLGKYTFVVDRDANKIEVAAAVRDLYGVEPVSVQVVNIEGKLVRFGRNMGREKHEKKAIVTLKKGESLTVVETA